VLSDQGEHGDLHTRALNRFYCMLAAANNGGMKIAQSFLESGRGWVESLVLGKPWALFVEGHEKTGDRFKIRHIVYCDLIIVNSYPYAPATTITYKHGKLNASPNQCGNSGTRRDESIDNCGKVLDRLKNGIQAARDASSLPRLTIVV